MLKFCINIFVLINILNFSTIGRSQNIDSLRHEWNIAGDDVKKKLEISITISDLYFNLQLDSLEKYSKAQIKLAKELGDKKAICSGYSNLGSISLRQGDADKALFFYSKSYSLAGAIGDAKKKLTSSANIASIYIMQGKYVKALKNYFIAKNNLFKLKELDEIDYDEVLKMEGQINNNIGIAYFNMNDFKNATRYYSEALSIAEKTKDVATIAKSYTNLGEIELIEKNYNVAESFLFKGKRLKEKIKDSLALKVNYILIGRLYLELGVLPKAKKFFDIGMKMLADFPDHNLMKTLKLNYSIYYLRLNDVDKSIRYLYEAQKMNGSEYDTKTAIDIAQLLSEAYFLKKDFEQSEIYRNRYERMKDSIYNTKQGLEIARLELYYNLTNKELKDSLEFTLSQKAGIQKDEEIRLKKVQNFYLIIWLIFIVIALGVIVYILNIVRKRNKSLQKAVIEKEALMKEVHHRVKNNFQIISSLLNIQSNKLKKKELVTPMLNMQNRIIAMALVHEKLYISGVKEAVFINNYIQDLVNSISRSLLSSKAKIEIKNEKDDFFLSLEKAIPLGLIINEIITNSIKYGAKEKDDVNILLDISNKEGAIKIILKDDGDGFPSNFDPEEVTDSIGLELVHVLVEQLEGSINFSNENGAKIEINFSI